MSERIDSIVFDIKESIDDFGNEVKMLMSEFKELKEKVRMLEERL